MEYIYPLFERNRILKKEHLWSLRDYPLAHMEMAYASYGDGLIQGCEVTVREGELAVGKGIVKKNGFLYFISRELTVPYKATEKWEVVKMKVETDKSSKETIAHRLTLFVDQETEKKENELEVCRFKLRQGSRLRTEYKNFLDMETEYDTINLLYGDWGGIGEQTIPLPVTDYFARLVLSEKGSREEDIQLAYVCLSQPLPVRREVIEHYVRRRTKEGDGNKIGNRELFHHLAWILEDIKEGKKGDRKQEERRRQIWVD